MARNTDAACPHAAPPSRIRLLIVEDELSTAFAVREFFALAGYDVDCAAGLRDTDILLAHNAYEAVITDLHLGAERRSEGLLVARHTRRRNPDACIVMLSGYGSDTAAEEAERNGVDMYHSKPVALEQLRQFIETTLRPAPGAVRI